MSDQVKIYHMSFNFKKLQIPLNTLQRIDRKTKWGNPFIIGKHGTREEVIKRYRIWLDEKLKEEPNFLEPLRNLNLLCWCAPLACHGDVILEKLYGKTKGDKN